MYTVIRKSKDLVLGCELGQLVVGQHSEPVFVLGGEISGDECSCVYEATAVFGMYETGDGMEVNNGTGVDHDVDATPCPLQRKPMELRALGIAELALSTALFIANALFLIILCRRRRMVNWKMNVYTLNLAMSDLFSSLALLVMSTSVMVMSDSGHRWCAGAHSPMPEWVQVGVQAIVTTSVLLTVLNYNILILAQYCAIRVPILHRTYCSSRRFRCVVIVAQWASVLAYVGTKCAVIIGHEVHRPVFSVTELTFMGLSIVWSVGAYSYVLHVAKTWQQRRLVRRAAAERLASTSQMSRIESEESLGTRQGQPRRRRLVTGPSLSDLWGIRQRYQTVTNAGVHLAIYVLACVPMWLVRVLTVLDLGVHNSGSMYDVYSCPSIWCSITVCLWFCRGVLDPVVFVWRHPDLVRSVQTNQNVQLVNTVTRDGGCPGKELSEIR